MCQVSREKISAVFIFGIKGAKKDKILSSLKDRFFVMAGPIDVNFGVFSETYVRLLKSITSQFFSRFSKCYNNLNIKSCLNSTALNKKAGCTGVAKKHVPNTTL